ncbi:MAG: hypothetical protein BHW38_04710 [Firmicutes bacterium CAG:321_26_22]|nr:MAG: hypothetical protein BHW38_04710 [Firmicutes bacterium CAG:321_26_22]
MKKRVIIVVGIIIAAIAIAGLYQTFALSNNITANGDMYTVTVGDGSVVSVPAGSSKTVYYKITNKNKGAVNYGVGYTGTGLTVKVFSDSDADAQDKINYGESKFIKLYVENKSTNSASTTLSTILGYENGGELIVPSGVSIVSEIHLGTLSRYITHLYNDANKTTVTNNSINYSYATANKIMKDNNDNLRYYGASPNNYVYFNCETYPSTNCEKWRIVGVFDGKTKLIRNESIGSYSWDTSSSTVNSGNGKNDWTQATLMKLLNPGYDDESAGASLYYNAEEGNCYNAANNGTGACNFTSSGIKNDSTRNIIADTTWPLGSGNAATYANLVYAKERGSNVFSGNSISWQGKVAVPYASDYGYAADFNNCTGELNAYNNSTCTANNWMKGIFNGAFAHLLTTYPDNGYVAWSVEDSGATAYSAYNTAQAEAVVPTLYLIAQTEVAGGEGTSANPYYLNVGNSDSSTYTVRYNANGGKNAPTNQTKTKDVSLTLNSGVPSKDGYTFKGWATTSSATTATYQPGGSYTTNKSITLYAVWSQNKVIVRFNTNSGTLASSTTYNGTTYTWTASGGTVSRKVGSGTATSDFFTINYGSQTGSDGLPDRSDTSTYLKITRSGYTTIADSAWVCKSGCTTSGKVFASGTVYNASDFCNASSANCTVELNANWQKVHTITYNANGGSGAPASQSVINGSSFTASSTKPIRTGYTFLGWGSSSGATTVSYTPGTTYTPTSDLTLYAIWKINKVNFKFSTNGGTVQVTSSSSGNTYKWKQDSNGIVSRTDPNGSTYSEVFYTLDYGANTNSSGFPNYNNSGFLNITYSGYSAPENYEWKCLSGCSTNGKLFNQDSVYKASDLCDASSSDCTVVLGVNWKQVQTITYDANGGSGAPASQTKLDGSSITLSSTKPTRSGYTFVNWNTKADGSGTSYNAGTAYTAIGTTTLYAQWEARVYTVTLNTQSATSNGTAKVYYQYNTTKTVNGTVCYYYTDSSLTNCLSSGYVLTKPTKTGYTFNGYYTSTSGGGTQYVDKDGRFIHNLYTTIGNKTLYAYWSPAVYTITLNNQSATTAGTPTVYYQYNTTKTINGTVCYYYTNSTLTSCLSGGYNITKPTKTAYVFGGYYTGTNGSGTNYVNSSGTFINNAYQTTGNKTLYAKWTKNTTAPGLDYDPSGAYRVCSGTRLTLTCTDRSGSGKISAWMHDNDTISTGTGTTTANARDNLNTLRSGGITTEFKCTDGNGNVSTASTKYTVVSCTSSGGSGGGAISTGKCSCSIAKDCIGTGRYDTKCVNGACYWANESGGALRGCF